VALVHARALVLQSFPYSDTSKILRLYTLELGLRSVIAKGALRPRSRFGGVLEPFTEGEAQFYLKEGRDLHTLGGFDLLRSRQAIGRDLGAFAGASLLAELLLRFGTEEPHPELFRAVSGALDRIVRADAGRATRVALAGVWEAIALLGFQPELEHCVGCGREIRSDEATRFDVDAGGVACTGCRLAGRMVHPAIRRDLRAMTRGDEAPDPTDDWSMHRALLRVFVSAHLSPEHPLRSLDLFVDHLG
jgi:DNA repair protein RecO (recombination protein O)